MPFLLLVGALLSVQSGPTCSCRPPTGSPSARPRCSSSIGAALLLGAERDRRHARGVRADRRRRAVAPRRRARLRRLHHRGHPAVPAARRDRDGRACSSPGQMLVSLLLDVTGWLGVAEQRDRRAAALIGAASVLAGVALVVRAQPGAAARGRRWGWMAFAVLGGAVLPLQGAINAQLRADLDAPIAAGAWSFASRAARCCSSSRRGRRRAPRPRLDRLDRVPWWGWLGGAVRRDLRHVGVPADPRDRRRADDRAHGRRSAARVGLRRRLRPAAAPAPADHRHAARRRRGPARRRRPIQAA